MFAIRRAKIHRRSLLVTIGSSLAVLSLPRGSNAAEIDTHHNPSSAPLRPHGGKPIDQVLRTIDLKTVGPAQQVASIRYSDGTYYVVTNSGKTASFPEFNLHFKTDSSAHGPAANRPVLLSAGMRGDRGSIVFSNATEIGRLIEDKL